MNEKFWDWEGPHKALSTNDKGGEIHVFRCRKGSKTYTMVQKYYHDKDGTLKPAKGCAIPDDLADEVADLILTVGDDKEEGRK